VRDVVAVVSGERVRTGAAGIGTPPRVPVVSVGNLAMGGRGKTPVVAAVARLLLQSGERPSILSRGYGRRRAEDGVVVVTDGRYLFADVDTAGDEPLMLARQLAAGSPVSCRSTSAPGAAVLVCDVRAMAAALAEERFGVSVHVLDDGFQHTSLRRDVDIVLVAADDLRDRRLPFGRLRSSVSTLRYADAVIVEKGDDEARRGLASIVDPARTPVFALDRRLGEPMELLPSNDTGAPDRGMPVVALAGIANPGRFTRALEADGWQVADTAAFGDHHRYSRADLERIARTAAGRFVLTTEKDAVRLLPLRPLPFRAAAVPLVATITPEPTFLAWLTDRLSEARA
jgi:tetraacyldisaccharide 4'-kinase